MAGSYNHIVTNSGNLKSNERIVETLENGGDVFECVEEMYGMIWYIVDQFGFQTNQTRKDLVERARQNYKEGLTIAKHVNGGGD